MSSLKPQSLSLDVLANAAGQMLPALLVIFLQPIYLAIVGTEGLGIISFFATIEMVLAVIVNSVGQGYQRRLVQHPESAAELHAASERAYVRLGAAIAALIIALAWPIATWWIDVSVFTVTDVALAFSIAGLRIGFSLPASIYAGTLLAKHQQVRLNAIQVVGLLLAYSLGLCVLFLSRRLVGLTATHLLVALVVLWQLRRVAHRALPPASEGKGFRALLRETMPLLWTSLAGLVLQQSDRGILVRQPENLGVYAPGQQPARLIIALASAFWLASYPRVCAVTSDRERLRGMLRHNLAVVLTGVSSLCIVACCFAGEVLDVWLRNEEVTSGAKPVMQVALCGAFFAVAGGVYHQAQMASRRLKVNAVLNTVNVIWFLPVLVLSIANFGITGAAYCLATVYFLAWAVPLIHVSLTLVGLSEIAWHLLITIVYPSIPLAAGLAARQLAWHTFPTSPALRLLFGLGAGGLSLSVLGAITWAMNRFSCKRSVHK